MMVRRKAQALATVLLATVIATLYCSEAPAIFSDGGDQPDIARSEKIFVRECADCHGRDGRGQMLNQPSFKDPEWQRSVTDDHIFKAIKIGKEPMPFFVGALSDDEIRGLVRYIRSLADRDDLSQKAGATDSHNRGCAGCHAKPSDQAAELFSHSAHAVAGITCDRCHGGNPFAADKQQAHGGRFVGKPTESEMVSMCGSCHRPQLAAFKAGRHFSERRTTSRVDCVQCHGAHTVGAAARDFSFAYFCAGCHGLEYLPELPSEFQRMMAMSDDLRQSFRAMRESGISQSADLARRRKEIRRMLADVVHSTDLDGGRRKAPEILKLGDELKQAIQQAK